MTRVKTGARIACIIRVKTGVVDCWHGIQQRGIRGFVKCKKKLKIQCVLYVR